MRGFPITIGSKTFTQFTFTGRRYKTAYPELLYTISQELSLANLFESVTPLAKDFYPIIGKSYSFTLQAGRLFSQGMAFSASDDEGGMFYGFFNSYDSVTGEAELYITGHEGMRMFDIMRLEAVGISYTPDGNRIEPSDAGMGLYGLTRPYEWNTIFPFPNEHDWWVWEETFNWHPDFTSNDNAHPYVVHSPALEGYTQESGYPLTIDGTTSNALIHYGQGITHPVANTFYKAGVRLTDLSTADNRYKFRIGLTKANINESLFTTSGFGFTYSDNESSGNWQFVYSLDGVLTTVDTGVAAVADSTVHLELSFETNTSFVTDVKVKINGVLVHTVAITNNQWTSIDEYMTAGVQLTSVFQSSPAQNAVILEYMYMRRPTWASSNF